MSCPQRNNCRRSSSESPSLGGQLQNFGGVWTLVARMKVSKVSGSRRLRVEFEFDLRNRSETLSYDDDFIHSHSHVEEYVEVKTTPSEPVSKVTTAPVEGGTMQFAIDLVNTVMSKMAEQQVASKLSELEIREKELDNARRIADENWKRQKAWEEEK